jgi:hypothetical protein
MLSFNDGKAGRLMTGPLTIFVGYGILEEVFDWQNKMR